MTKIMPEEVVDTATGVYDLQEGFVKYPEITNNWISFIQGQKMLLQNLTTQIHY